MSSFQQRHRDTNRGPSTTTNSKTKVNHLLRELESEFDKMILENLQLRDRISALETNQTSDAVGINENQNQTVENPLTPSKSEVEHGETFDKNMLKTFTKNKAFKTRHKLKAHTSKIVSSFKPPAMSCMLVKEFRVSSHFFHIWI